MKIKVEELTPKMWSDIELLFGANGACGGCWCMSWRVEKGEKWDDIKGDEAKKRFKKLVESGKAHGAIAYADGQPAGWCSFDKRRDYAKLDRAPSLKCHDADEVWSIPCFFIKREFRGKGVGTQLLAFALTAIKARGGKIAEGYPAAPARSGEKLADAFAWTGTPKMFTVAGFVRADDKPGGKQRMRKSLV